MGLIGGVDDEVCLLVGRDVYACDRCVCRSCGGADVVVVRMKESAPVPRYVRYLNADRRGGWTLPARTGGAPQHVEGVGVLDFV